MSTIDYAPTRPADLRDMLEAQSHARQIEFDNEVADFGWLMSVPEGRRTVLRLIKRARVLASTFDPSNQYQTAHNEGFRRYGTEIAELVNARFPKLYALMMQEAHQ